MGLFDAFRRTDINEGVRRFKESKGALLLDVRTAQEYAQGHIPGSVNLPLDSIRNIVKLTKDSDTQLYVHCLSGARSSRATAQLKDMGYERVLNIGGISSWRGELERGLQG